MRGIIDVVEKNTIPKVNVVKSVKEIGRLINQAAIPTAKIKKEDYNKNQNYEEHYGQRENRFINKPIEQSCIFKDR